MSKSIRITAAKHKEGHWQASAHLFSVHITIYSEERPIGAQLLPPKIFLF